MTWVEVVIVFSIGALIVSMWIPSRRLQRAVQIVAAIVVLAVLARFGSEFVADLLGAAP
jgi:hypothetical protein